MPEPETGPPTTEALFHQVQEQLATLAFCCDIFLHVGGLTHQEITPQCLRDFDRLLARLMRIRSELQALPRVLPVGKPRLVSKEGEWPTA